MFRKLFRTKPAHSSSHTDLHRCLNAFDLTLMGIGAIIGAGVFVLTGIAAATKGGPAIVVSYVIAGFAAMFAALAYAELASSIGGCGSAYSYAYTGFGEFLAWVIGWILILEYAIASSTISIGWSGYVANFLQAMNIHIPEYLLKNPFEGGFINLPAFLIICTLAIVLSLGTKQSSRFNAIIVFIKLFTIALFIAVAAVNVNPANWHPFMPFGFSGVVSGAALVFFAYIGFDALSTAVEETIEPQRNIPIGIIASLLICTAVYIVVSALLTGIAHYTTLNVESPVANALLQLGHNKVAGWIAAGAIAGLTTTVLVMYYGLTRICFAISRDGLLPAFFAKINRRTHTPVPLILTSGLVMALIAGFTPIDQGAKLVNIGTLAAFVFVCAGVIAARITHPELHRPFKLPLNPLIPGLGVLFCGYLMLNLPAITWISFLIWTAIGVVIYFCYGQRNSVLGKEIVNSSQT